MKEKHKGAAIAGALAIVAVIVFAVALTQQLGVKPEPIIPVEPESNASLEQHPCSPESRTAQMCIQLYQPVCGWFDPARIQCIKYPCAQTFSNSCFACMDGKVQYWTEGECK